MTFVQSSLNFYKFYQIPIYLFQISNKVSLNNLKRILSNLERNIFGVKFSYSVKSIA